MTFFIVLGWLMCAVLCLWTTVAAYCSLHLCEGKYTTLMLVGIATLCWIGLISFSPFTIVIGG
jgi:hypothetical protein